MNDSIFLTYLGKTNNTKILNFFMKHTCGYYTIKEISKSIDIPQVQTKEIINQFLHIGFITTDYQESYTLKINDLTRALNTLDGVLVRFTRDIEEYENGEKNEK